MCPVREGYAFELKALLFKVKKKKQLTLGEKQYNCKLIMLQKLPAL